MLDSDYSLTENPPLPFKQELLNLYDSYIEFNCYYAIYCESSSVLIQRHCVGLEKDYTEGIVKFARDLNEKSRRINAQLQRLMRSV